MPKRLLLWFRVPLSLVFFCGWHSLACKTWGCVVFLFALFFLAGVVEESVAIAN